MSFPSNKPELNQIVDHLFRNQSGKMVATFTRLFGLNHLQLAEDVVQDAFIKAQELWLYKGIPENPTGWLWKVAKNKAIDLLRREKTLRNKRLIVIQDGDGEYDVPNFFIDEELKDDLLRMIFICCHPVMSQESQVMLTLKTLCGFSLPEIARAFLTKEQTTAKRLVRAKQKISELKIPYEIPAASELTKRLESVLQVLYLLFNEGYSASYGDNMIRPDLCNEAIKLTTLLIDHPLTDRPLTHALLALMLLNASRLRTRFDKGGNLLLLKEQDRSLWDRVMINKGLFHLHKSANGRDISEYHLQAAISAHHSLAKSYESTDWKQILSLYDIYVKLNDSPVVALNRVVALSKVYGPKAGIDGINKIANLKTLKLYHLLYSILADFHLQLNDYKEALNNYQKALELSKVKVERSFYREKVKICQQQIDISKRYSP